jgi:surface antigen
MTFRKTFTKLWITLSEVLDNALNLNINSKLKEKYFMMRFNRHNQKVALSMAMSTLMLSSVAWVAPTYAAENANDTYDYRLECPTPTGGKVVADPWWFFKCECTSYVADKLNERGVRFTNYYKGPRWSNAINWRDVAKRVGIPVSNTPKAGSVAWFSYGHVAYVQSVNSNGTVTISEYNYYTTRDPAGRYDYRTRTISASSVSAYIHF